MSEPVCTQKAPYELELEADEYWWCACGKSKTQPFCDGAHQGSEFAPQPFTLKEKTKVWLCGCRHSAKPPFCDGTHNSL